MSTNPTLLEAQLLDCSYLLDAIADGTVAVPDFQREFVWSDIQVKSLLGTVLNGWPAGSLLLMRSGESGFKVRSLEGAPPIDKIKYLVLDGQQRLTALYHALRNTGPSVYAIDTSNLDLNNFDETSLEDRIVSFRRADWERNYRSPERQRVRWLLPLHALQSASSFFEWRDEITLSLGDMDYKYRDDLTRFYRDHLSAIHRYNLPAVVLEAGLEVAAIARIFEKVNRTGTRLNAFDLMVARVYEPGWNLREQWEAALLADPLLDYFLNSDGMPVLEAISLKTRHDIGQKAVLDLPARLVHREWDGAINGMRIAVQHSFRELGVRVGDWIPYGVMLVALSALAAENFFEENTPLVNAWFWSRGFGQAFDAAANTRILADYDRLLTASRKRQVSLAPVTPIRASTLLEATRRGQRAIWAMFMCALVTNGAVDPITLRPVYGDLPSVAFPQELAAAGRMITSLFDRQYLGSDGLHLRVLGLVQLSRSSSNILKSTGLTGLLDIALQQNGEDAVDRALASQFLPPSAQLMSGGLGLELLDGRLERLNSFLNDHGTVIELE